MEPTEQILHLVSTARSLPRTAMRGDYGANCDNHNILRPCGKACSQKNYIRAEFSIKSNSI
ncbi:MAG: hypothetical protein U9P70_04325 [Patescibacteria group bacterium]|nr:hypothetical protein [Patescibacteria group bacterium]